jgi:hypothetical protein
MGIMMSPKQVFLELMKINPGAGMELGTTWLCLNDQKRINLRSKLKVKKNEISKIMNEVINESEEIWYNKNEIDQAIKDGSIPDFQTIYKHPSGGFFSINGGGMSAEDMVFLNEEEVKDITNEK